MYINILYQYSSCLKLITCVKPGILNILGNLWCKFTLLVYKSVSNLYPYFLLCTCKKDLSFASLFYYCFMLLNFAPTIIICQLVYIFQHVAPKDSIFACSCGQKWVIDGACLDHRNGVWIHVGKSSWLVTGWAQQGIFFCGKIYYSLKRIGLLETNHTSLCVFCLVFYARLLTL